MFGFGSWLRLRIQPFLLSRLALQILFQLRPGSCFDFFQILLLIPFLLLLPLRLRLEQFGRQQNSCCKLGGHKLIGAEILVIAAKAPTSVHSPRPREALGSGASHQTPPYPQRQLRHFRHPLLDDVTALFSESLVSCIGNAAPARSGDGCTVFESVTCLHR